MLCQGHLPPTSLSQEPSGIPSKAGSCCLSGQSSWQRAMLDARLEFLPSFCGVRIWCPQSQPLATAEGEELLPGRATAHALCPPLPSLVAQPPLSSPREDQTTVHRPQCQGLCRFTEASPQLAVVPTFKKQMGEDPLSGTTLSRETLLPVQVSDYNAVSLIWLECPKWREPALSHILCEFCTWQSVTHSLQKL